MLDKQNMVSFIHTLIYIAYLALLYTQDDYDTITVKGLQCGLVLASFIRMNMLLCIFEELSHLVNILPKVF